MRVDIIIPTYKPDDTFCLLLQKLQEQTFVIHELILVNTEEALWNEAVRKYPIEQIRKELPFSSRIFHMTRENFDHGGARNMGAGYSEADILIFMTQDAVPADERLVEHLVHALTSGAHGSGTPAKGAVAVAYARQLPRETAASSSAIPDSLIIPMRDASRAVRTYRGLALRLFSARTCALHTAGICLSSSADLNRRLFLTRICFLRRMQCRKDTRLRMRRTPRWFIRTTIR